MDKVFLKGLALLETLANHDEPRGITELANELGLTKSNVHRLLQALIHCGFAYQDEDSLRYACTFKMWQLGTQVWNRTDIKPIARPHLLELNRLTQETVHLSVREGTDVIYVDKVNCAHPIGTFTRIGGRAPAYCTATGKALLSTLPDAEVESLGIQFKPHTDKTLLTLEQLKAELARIRRQGFSTNRGEWNQGVGGVAAPVFNATQTACAAIGISGPLERLTPKIRKAYTQLVLDAASAISESLGRGPLNGAARTP
ncbi:IclR family transcriptional regulator [Halotalea alkalilenta]|uniref:IclR family transcriptional regulator n=1 Tax=Halotalea alkalilenta TaxID=376489 RepID=UPI00047FFDCA|nr:IclR family transcriptional regulator [Halotalea alkalilenta]